MVKCIHRHQRRAQLFPKTPPRLVQALWFNAHVAVQVTHKATRRVPQVALGAKRRP